MAKLYINESKKRGHINPEIYGHFAEHLGRCIYEGLYVGEKSEVPNENGIRKDVVEALKEMQVPVLRWPGGCFADEYHWKDGIGPKESRKKMVNTHWGGVTEDNSFGTHEYFELCKQLGCKTYVNGNLGSGSIQEMSEWVEYMTFDGISPMADLRKANGHEEAWKLDYFGVGNENWGCGGNMTPEYYANEYRRYQTYVRQYHDDAPVKKICCGANSADYEWTEKVLKTCFAFPHNNSGFMDGLSLHYYTVPGEEWSHKGSATDFSEKEWYKTLYKANRIEDLIKRHGTIMDTFDPEKKIGMMIDEWGCWFDVEPGTNPGFLYQQNTMRDALVAGLSLNIFNKHCDRVKMACIAQMVNVLQSVVLTEGVKMLLTPTYYVFHMYKHHQDGELLESFLENNGLAGEEKEYQVPVLSESVSEGKDGKITVTLSNLSLTQEEQVEISFSELKPGTVEAVILKGKMNDFNSFDEPEKVKEEVFADYKISERGLNLTVPACSVISLRISR
ncbi:MAG: alpha-N-arabinofuranosidase [Lachnospiraceae bacterium]|nr:alpha-N-arabinofuranosidase [Lachnospiraceae bacterium]